MKRMLVIPALLIALAAAACSTPGSSPQGAKSPSTTGPYQQFAACMREHGQNVPDPDPDGNVAMTPPAAANRSAWDAAMSACRKFLPGGGQPAAPSTQELEGLRAYAVCMREHGVELTDPDPGTGKSQFAGRLANATRDQIVNDPVYKAADAACKDKLVSGGGGK